MASHPVRPSHRSLHTRCTLCTRVQFGLSYVGIEQHHFTVESCKQPAGDNIRKRPSNLKLYFVYASESVADLCQSLAFSDASFDVVACNAVIQHILPQNVLAVTLSGGLAPENINKLTGHIARGAGRQVQRGLGDFFRRAPLRVAFGIKCSRHIRIHPTGVEAIDPNAVRP